MSDTGDFGLEFLFCGCLCFCQFCGSARIENGPCRRDDCELGVFRRPAGGESALLIHYARNGAGMHGGVDNIAVECYGIGS